jgi:hypothetical protein
MKSRSRKAHRKRHQRILQRDKSHGIARYFSESHRCSGENARFKVHHREKGTRANFFFSVTKNSTAVFYERSKEESCPHARAELKRPRKNHSKISEPRWQKKRRKKRDVSHAFATFASISGGKNSPKRKLDARLFRSFRFFPRRRIDARRKSRVKRDTFSKT